MGSRWGGAAIGRRDFSTRSRTPACAGRGGEVGASPGWPIPLHLTVAAVRGAKAFDGPRGDRTPG